MAEVWPKRQPAFFNLQNSLAGVSTSRITFTEVTKAAVLAAMQAPREVSQPLVDAYRARRALDYLVGYHISPVLWRKLPGARSAGLSPPPPRPQTPLHSLSGLLRNKPAKKYCITKQFGPGQLVELKALPTYRGGAVPTNDTV